MSTFSTEIVDAVVAHMNGDHRDDSLRIVRAFARPDATAARMTGLDGEAGLWEATTDEVGEELRIPWPAAPITERAEIRREVVALHEQACATLGITPPAH